jgi:hypothetical protein
MGNIWGIANPLPVALLSSVGSDVPCPTGGPTTLMFSSFIPVAGPGNYYPMVWGVIAILCGATPPTAISCGFNISGGSLVDSQTVPPAMLVANATIILPVAMVGPNSATAWLGGTGYIGFTLTPTAQAVTFKFSGSRILVALFRGPDA